MLKKWSTLRWPVLVCTALKNICLPFVIPPNVTSLRVRATKLFASTTTCHDKLNWKVRKFLNVVQEDKLKQFLYFYSVWNHWNDSKFDIFTVYENNQTVANLIFLQFTKSSNRKSYLQCVKVTVVQVQEGYEKKYWCSIFFVLGHITFNWSLIELNSILLNV